MSDVLRAFEHGGSDVAVGNGRPASQGSGPVERIQIGRPVLPCDRCSHRVVCAIKPKLEAAAIEVRAPASPDPNVTISVSVALTCAFFADDGSPAEAAPRRIVTDPRAKAILGGRAAKAARATAGATPRPFVSPSLAPRALAIGTGPAAPTLKGWAAKAAERDVEIVEAVRTAGSVTAASIQLGISASRVRQLLDRARARGILPAEVDALVRKRGPKGPRPKLDDEADE